MNSGNSLSKAFITQTKPSYRAGSGSGAMLTHKNDPLVLNGETANELIESKKQNLLFLGKGKQINWYSALVKQLDFVKTGQRNQILQKTVYAGGKELTAKVNAFIENQKLSLKEAHACLEKYSGVRIVLKNSSKWFSNSCFPLVYLRALSLFETDSQKALAGFLSSVEYFTDFLEKSRFSIPKNKDFIFDKYLAYLAGCSAGDGHISPDSRRWVLVDGTPHKSRLPFSRQFVENLSRLLSKHVNSFRIHSIGKKVELIINNKPFCRFLNFVYGLPIGPKKHQLLRRPIVFNLLQKTPKEQAIAAFWRGCFDTDGTVNKHGTVSFASVNRALLEDALSDFSYFGISARVSRVELRVPMPEVKKFAKIGFAHPSKKTIFSNLLKQGPKYTVLHGVDSQTVSNGVVNYALLSAIRIKARNKQTKLPSEITARILDLVSVLRPWGDRARVSTYSQENIDLKHIKEEVKNIFGLKLIIAKTPVIRSQVLCDYLDKFFIFAPAWEAINNEELAYYEKCWCDFLW